MSDERHIPKKIEVSQTPGMMDRRIEIDGDLFPYYTFGPITCDEHPDIRGLRIVHIPVVCDEAEFSKPDS